MLRGLVVSHDSVKTRVKVTKIMKIKYSSLLCPEKLFPTDGLPQERREEKRKEQLITFFLAVAHLESSDLHCNPC